MSGQYVDATFSNKIADNKQFPVPIEGFCFGGTDLLSAKVVRETSSTLLLEVTYCNDVVGDKAVLGLDLSRGQERVGKWAYTPGGTVVGYGRGYVRLSVSDLEEPVTLSDYVLWIYGNNSGSDLISYPFRYEKLWCTGIKCND